MKNLFLILALSLMCRQKASAQVVFPNSDSVISYLKGSWTWYKSCGGLAYGCLTPTNSPTKGLVFSRISGVTDSIHYKYLENNVLISEHTTKIRYGATIYGNSWSLDTISGFSQTLAVCTSCNPDTAYFSDNCTDCYFHFFSRNASPSVGIPERYQNTVKIAPNPVKESLQFSLDMPFEKMDIHIYDIAGKSINVSSVTEDRLDVSQLQPGIYFLTFTAGNITYRSKVIKE